MPNVPGEDKRGGGGGGGEGEGVGRACRFFGCSSISLAGLVLISRFCGLGVVEYASKMKLSILVKTGSI